MTVRLMRHGQRVDRAFGRRPSPSSSGREQRRERGLAEPAEGQRRERDAELAGRQIGGELLRDAEQQAGAAAALAARAAAAGWAGS